MDNNNKELAVFSSKIDDPAFAKYIKNSNQWAQYFSLGLAMIAVVGFYIYGETSSEMNNPEAFYIGLAIGGMFLLIALFQITGRKKGVTWDGTVVDKKTKKKSKRDDDSWRDYLEYKVTIKRDNGKKYYIAANNDNKIYNYYNIGDRVRHHKGINSYEKQDKRGDTIIFCNACASLKKMKDDFCFRCKCPLLK